MAVSWNKILLGARGIQAVLAVVVLGLMAYVASWWGSHWRAMAPVEVNFLIFSPVWTILALVPLVVVPLKLTSLATSTIGKFGLLVLEVLTMLYWFGGFIALALFLRDRICFGAVCDMAKAGTALSAVSWLVWAGSVVISVVMIMRGRNYVAPLLKEPKVEMHQGV
ncbi:hypothetical protein BU23DRAFT_147990 [Bimuria novae-zelandiae CBS 107.79]|uniref:MARVEL domain-containing protein n=1 Tax=Bimuria novae-zelandiae CBS 107.79 TaxID=1447943 RepID=A0A6A5VN09_9PLEO|nr:hypothetical protein BU23DRAFT_147990 [Bimuria novae-zelandiae CBS 107.79]